MMFNFALRQQFVKDEVHRDENGFFSDVDRTRFSYFKDSPVEIAKRNIHVMDMIRHDENTKDVYVSVDGEVVAIVRFAFKDKKGTLMWQPTSVFKYGIDTERKYYYLQSRIMETARNYYETALIVATPQEDAKEYSVAYTTIEPDRRYEVFVSNNDGVIGSMKFQGSVDGEVLPENSDVKKVAQAYNKTMLSTLAPLLKEGEFAVTMVAVLPFDKYTIFASHGPHVALVEFSPSNPQGSLTWQTTLPDEDVDYYATKLIALAKKQYEKLLVAANNRPFVRKLNVAYAVMLPYDRYNVFVAGNNEIIAAVEFNLVNQQGTIFWQKASIDSQHRDARERFGDKENEIVKMAKVYFEEHNVWPKRNYRRDPEQEIKLAY